MDQKKLFVTASVSIAIVIIFSFSSASTITAADCKMIKIINSTNPPLVFKPQALTLATGDCVVWFNASNEPIRVNFISDKGCSSPVGFNKENTCFVTNWTSPGETVSLVLNEAGSYDFEITTRNSPTQKVLGRVLVKCN